MNIAEAGPTSEPLVSPVLSQLAADEAACKTVPQSRTTYNRKVIDYSKIANRITVIKEIVNNSYKPKFLNCTLTHKGLKPITGTRTSHSKKRGSLQPRPGFSGEGHPTPI